MCHVLIDEGDIVLEAEALDRRDEMVAVGLAIVAAQFGVGLTRDQVEGRGMAGHDRRHGFDHELDALARVDQAKRGDDRSAWHAQLLLHPDPAVGLDRGHAMRYHHRHLGDAVRAGEDVGRRLGHHDGRGAEPNRRADRLPHRGRRVRWHRVQRGDDRLPQGFEERSQVIVIDVVFPCPVEPEFVLDIDDVDVGAVDRFSRHAVVARVPLPDAPAHLAAIGPDLVGLVDRGHAEPGAWIGGFNRGHQVGRERGDSAPPGQIRTYEGDPEVVANVLNLLEHQGIVRAAPITASATKAGWPLESPAPACRRWLATAGITTPSP